MPAKKLDGRAVAQRMTSRLKPLVQRHRQPITLATILVGGRFDSALYVRLKRQAAANVGIRTKFIHLPATITQASLHRRLVALNRDRRIQGILLQLPLPKGLNADAAVAVIDPHKDVDGFHPLNHAVVPPPVGAAIRLLTAAKPPRHGLVVILAKASIFVQYLAAIFERQGYDVVIENARHRIPAVTKQAAIIITALGRGPQLGAQHIKRGAIIIDVGIRSKGKKTIGDVLPSAWTKAKAISPVPGGVGPVTVACVLYNTYILSTHSHS